MRRSLKYFFWFLIFGLVYNHSAANQLDSAEWKSLTKDLEYQPPSPKTEAVKLPKIPKVEGGEYQKDDRKKGFQYEKNKDQSISSSFDFSTLNIFIYIAMGIILLFLLYRLWRIRMNSIKDGSPKTLAEIPDPENPDVLDENDIRSEFQKALDDEDYTRCIRFLFLEMLQRLESKNHLVWHKYKTNGQYLTELANHPEFVEIRELTFLYEFYWYGQKEASLHMYQIFLNEFNHLTGLWKDE